MASITLGPVAFPGELVLLGTSLALALLMAALWRAIQKDSARSTSPACETRNSTSPISPPTSVPLMRM